MGGLRYSGQFSTSGNKVLTQKLYVYVKMKSRILYLKDHEVKNFMAKRSWSFCFISA